MLGLDTPWLRLLLLARDERGIFRACVGPHAQRPGFVMEWQLGVNVRKQIAAYVLRHLPGTPENLRLDIYDPVTPHVVTDEGQAALLVPVVILDAAMAVPADWPTYPALLAALPADRGRLPYLKVFQLLSGAAQETLHALPVDERLKDALRESPPHKNT